MVEPWEVCRIAAPPRCDPTCGQREVAGDLLETESKGKVVEAVLFGISGILPRVHSCGLELHDKEPVQRRRQCLHHPCSVKNQPKVKTPVTHVDSRGVADSGDETEPHDAGLLKLLQSVSYRL